MIITDVGSRSGTDLYELAKRKIWNVDSSLQWPDSCSQDQYPFAPSANLFIGFPPHDALPSCEKVKVAWQQHGVEISTLLCGETAALILAAQILVEIPNIRDRLFLGSQVFDEARHVEFFDRYLKETVRQPYEPGAAFSSFTEELISCKSIETRLMGCQLIIESLALAKLAQLKRDSQVPLLVSAITLILKDEARHVRFGVNYLHDVFDQLTPHERRRKTHYVIATLYRLVEDIRSYLVIGERYGWDNKALLNHLRRKRLSSPGLMHEAVRQLTVNLRAAGLDDTALKTLFRSA
ncbi:MAG: ferritin-like domain-containing protein [Pseudohongiellaceae bacterium]